jgi:hypothetical protein
MGNVYRTSGRLREARNCLTKSLDIYATLLVPAGNRDFSAFCSEKAGSGQAADTHPYP